jgi:hypothetical protein
MIWLGYEAAIFIPWQLLQLQVPAAVQDRYSRDASEFI